MYTRSKPGFVDDRGLLTQRLAATFQFLRVGASIQRGTEWFLINSAPSMGLFEAAHGRSQDRYDYNDSTVARVRKERRTALVTMAGFSDFFVPIGTKSEVHAVLVTGPFATHRPKSEDVLERWRWLTGRQGHPSDPEFAHYLSMTLDALTLEGDQIGRYQRWLECFAALVGGQGDAQALASRGLELGIELEQARMVDRVWEATRSMVNERTTRSWLAPHIAEGLSPIGLSRIPEQVIVGLLRGRPEAPDAVGELIGRDGFQRACVDLARSLKDVVAGRVGDHGVMFLVGSSSSGARLRAKLQQVGQQAADLARRRFRLSLHLGTSVLEGSATLAVRYEQALGAAERALSEGLTVAHAVPGAGRLVSPIRQLRRSLGNVAEQRPSTLAATFERYIEAIAIDSGYRQELARVHLEAGFDEASRALLSSGALPEKGYSEMCEVLEQAARHATTVSDLFAAYRQAISDLVELVERPVRAAQDRSLRRAIIFIDQHFAEPIGSAQVARIAGFSPQHFCELFRQRERTTFEHYVRGLRIERAKQLLKGTKLSAERVGQLAGFRLRPYFHRAFKQSIGLTPRQYRQRKV